LSNVAESGKWNGGPTHADLRPGLTWTELNNASSEGFHDPPL